MYYALLDLLLTFLERGPGYLSRPKNELITIGALELDVLSPEEERRPRVGYIFDNDESKYGMLAPEFVVQGVELGVHVLLEATEWAEKVLSRVGQISLSLDG